MDLAPERPRACGVRSGDHGLGDFPGSRPSAEMVESRHEHDAASGTGIAAGNGCTRHGDPCANEARTVICRVAAPAPERECDRIPSDISRRFLPVPGHSERGRSGGDSPPPRRTAVGAIVRLPQKSSSPTTIPRMSSCWRRISAISSARSGRRTTARRRLKAVEEFAPDLLLLDVMMPRLSGFEVCRKIRANPTTKSS